jgi:tetratricopeptide (TPR) repeat protein
LDELATINAIGRYDGWKSIARYLGRDRTTAMRWAAERGLPVRRLPGGKRGSVYALGPELDAWMAGLDNATAHPKAARLDRRTLVLGGLGAVAVAGATGLYLRRKRGAPSHIQPLLDQARLLRSQNSLDTQNQAIGLAREAVRLAPRSADAWGALGYAQATASHWRREPESQELREQAAAAGQRALDLDPTSAKGELALAAALPLLGANDWLARADGLKRALANDPSDPDVLIESAWILRFTGHQAAAVEMCRRVDPRDYTPPLFNIWIRALWSAGRIAEMNRRLETAALRYPGIRMLWSTRLELLMFGGRGDEARAAARNRRNRPSAVGDAQAEDVAAFAVALAGNDPGLTDAFLRVLERQAREDEGKAISAIRFASMKGRLDEAFALADAYFFGRGFAVGESMGNGLFIPLSQRRTNFLFEPPIAAMRADPRFATLTTELGLERYWRQANRPPDYRLHPSKGSVRA